MQENKISNMQKWISLGILVIGTFMAILDSSIVNIAIPKMMSVFGVSLEEVQWILTSYNLTLGAIIPLTGYLGDVFGKKKLYIFSLAAFTIGSLLCGFAWSNTSMIIFRVIQAIGGGMIMPVSMSIIYDIIPPEERSMALGLWGISAMAAPAIGPTLSGYIIQHLDWRLIFNINVPIGIVGVILSVLLLQSYPKKPIKKFDYLGFITSTLGMVSILYVLGEGSSIDWSEIKNIMLITFGVFNLILFVINELTHPEPLLELRVLKIPNFTLSIITSGILSMALMGGVYLVPLFLQNIRGYTAMQTGNILFPSAIATGIMMPISGKLLDKVGIRPLVVPGLIVLAIANFELSKINMNTSVNTIKFILTVRGLALGISMMPLTTAGMNSIPKHLISQASAIQSMTRQIASAICVAMISMIFQKQINLNYYRLSEQINYFNQPSMDFFNVIQGYFIQNGLLKSEAQGSALTVIRGLVQNQAYVIAIDNTLIIVTIATIVTILLSLMIKYKGNNKKADEEVQDAGGFH